MLYVVYRHQPFSYLYVPSCHSLFMSKPQLLVIFIGKRWTHSAQSKCACYPTHTPIAAHTESWLGITWLGRRWMRWGWGYWTMMTRARVRIIIEIMMVVIIRETLKKQSNPWLVNYQESVRMRYIALIQKRATIDKRYLPHTYIHPPCNLSTCQQTLLLGMEVIKSAERDIFLWDLYFFMADAA